MADSTTKWRHATRSAGLRIGTSARVDNLVARDNGIAGVLALGPGSVVVDSRISRNGSYGLDLVADTGFGANAIEGNGTAPVRGGIEIATNVCNGTTSDCRQMTGLGVACTTGLECASGFCVDGVCCDASCAGVCQSCTAASTGSADGTCSPIVAGTDPDAECAGGEVCNGTGMCAAPGLPVGSACTQDLECTTGVCWDFNDYDPFCFGTVCSATCTTDQNCIDIFTNAGAPNPGAATCGVDNRCNPLGTGFGSFACQ